MPKKMPGSIQKKSKKMNPIVCVNRSIYPPYPAYPYRMVKVTHPGLDKIGPARFDIRKLKPWLHNKQKSDQWIHGYEIYEYLIAEKILQSCLGLLDLVEIKKRGPIFFRQYFKDKAANAWKSVGVDFNGALFVPFLREEGASEVVLDWCPLNSGMDDRYVALCFPK